MTQLILHPYLAYKTTVNNVKINPLDPHVLVLVVVAIPMAPQGEMIDPLTAQHGAKTV